MTKSIADRVALLTYGVINMSMVSVSVGSVHYWQYLTQKSFCIRICKDVIIMKTLDLFARERAVVNREQIRTDYSR